MPLTDPRVLEPDIAIAMVDGHFVASLCGRPSAAVPVQLEAYVRRHAPEPKRFAYYLRLGEGASPPDERTRELLRALGTRLAPRIAAVSAVIEIPGFVGAAVRGVVTGMSLVLGRSIKIRASSSTREGCAAVEGLLRDAGLGSLDAATLDQALAELRALR